MPPIILGIDIGGSGIKGAPVDVSNGTLVDNRFRVETPQPAKPEPMAECVAEVVSHFGWTGPIGCTFPAVVQAGVVKTAANVDPAWISVDAETLITKATGSPTQVLNDADAAGVAEAAFGAAAGVGGVAVVLTLGTGVGSALFTGGALVANTEFGHIYFRGGAAERYVADSVRKSEALGWGEWAERLTAYLSYLEVLLWPELIVLGGGVSKQADEFLDLIQIRTPVVAASLRNNAGIVGAAMAAS